jgi:hypothetical protein
MSTGTCIAWHIMHVKCSLEFFLDEGGAGGQTEKPKTKLCAFLSSFSLLSFFLMSVGPACKPEADWEAEGSEVVDSDSEVVHEMSLFLRRCVMNAFFSP